MTDFGLEDVALGVAIQGGKIVAAGYNYTNVSTQVNFTVARYNTDGSLDASFDGDGKAVTDIGGTTSARGWRFRAGRRRSRLHIRNGESRELRQLRSGALQLDGSLDTSFDGDGKVVTDFGGADEAFGVAIPGAGRSSPPATAFCQGAPTTLPSPATTPTAADTSFDGDGRVVTDIAVHDVGQAVAIQGDKIVAAGYKYSATGTQQDFVLARYNADGSLDASFDGDGKVVTDFGGADVAYALAIEGEKIVAAGYSDTGRIHQLRSGPLRRGLPAPEGRVAPARLPRSGLCPVHRGQPPAWAAAVLPIVHAAAAGLWPAHRRHPGRQLPAGELRQLRAIRGDRRGSVDAAERGRRAGHGLDDRHPPAQRPVRLQRRAAGQPDRADHRPQQRGFWNRPSHDGGHAIPITTPCATTASSSIGAPAR